MFFPRSGKDDIKIYLGDFFLLSKHSLNMFISALASFKNSTHTFALQFYANVWVQMELVNSTNHL